MIHRSSSSTCTKAIAGGLSLLAFSCALAQTAQPELAPPAARLKQPVPLVADTCPTVRQDGVLSLDWNPAFDPSGAVTGLKSFRLIFDHLLADGVHPNPAARLVLDVGPGGRMTAIGNGYFHIEMRLPPSTHPGTYHLVAAHGSPTLSPDYQGEAPTMTNSPEREYFCITVISHTPSKPSAG